MQWYEGANPDMGIGAAQSGGVRAYLGRLWD